MTADFGNSNAIKENVARIEARISGLGTNLNILMVLNAGGLIAIFADGLARQIEGEGEMFPLVLELLRALVDALTDRIGNRAKSGTLLPIIAIIVGIILVGLFF